MAEAAAAAKAWTSADREDREAEDLRQGSGGDVVQEVALRDEGGAGADALGDAARRRRYLDEAGTVMERSARGLRVRWRCACRQARLNGCSKKTVVLAGLDDGRREGDRHLLVAVRRRGRRLDLLDVRTRRVVRRLRGDMDVLPLDVFLGLRRWVAWGLRGELDMLLFHDILGLRRRIACSTTLMGARACKAKGVSALMCTKLAGGHRDEVHRIGGVSLSWSF